MIKPEAQSRTKIINTIAKSPTTLPVYISFNPTLHTFDKLDTNLNLLVSLNVVHLYCAEIQVTVTKHKMYFYILFVKERREEKNIFQITHTIHFMGETRSG